MILAYLDDNIPYTEIPTWKDFEHDEYDRDETPIIGDREEMQQEGRETPEEMNS